MIKTIKVFKALSEEMRLKMLRHLLSQGELSCRELSEKFSLSQPAFSHHVHKLIEAGLVTVRKEGVAHYYKAETAQLEKVGINIQSLITIES
jgi:ArsR family transcriptional regulator, arsenate/arsenite/antimonite-responsive transcriptional repressor